MRNDALDDLTMCRLAGSRHGQGSRGEHHTNGPTTSARAAAADARKHRHPAVSQRFSRDASSRAPRLGLPLGVSDEPTLRNCPGARLLTAMAEAAMVAFIRSPRVALVI
jgi:hypothetical protein